jgi:dTDP-4-amino-4,6-dideoxygalactose transaminase
VLFENEERLIEVKNAMNSVGINPRRYFYPSLDTLEYLHPPTSQTESRDIASRVMCLPIYPGLALNKIEEIIKLLNDNIGMR